MLKRLLFSISSLVLLSTVFSTDHALYIGVIQIEEQRDTAASIRIKIFSDDLQTALQNAYGFNEIEATNHLCSSQSDKIISYFQEHLRITINDLKSDIRLEDCEIINDVHLLHFELTAPSTWEKIEIKAPFFMEVFPTQTNMVHLSYKGTTLYGKMTKQEPTYKIGL